MISIILINKYSPDILVLTGHDGMIKAGTKYSDISNYTHGQLANYTHEEVRNSSELRGGNNG